MVKTRELAEQIEKYGFFRVSRRRPRIRLTIFTPDEGFARRLADEEGRKLYVYDYEDDARRFYAVPFEVRDTTRLVIRCQFHFCKAHKRLALNLGWLERLNKAVKGRAWSANITGFRVHAYQAAIAERDAAVYPLLDYIASGGLFRECPRHVPYIKKRAIDKQSKTV